MCGGISQAAIAAGQLTAWAQCWFLLLVTVVGITIAFLFLIALLAIIRL